MKKRKKKIKPRSSLTKIRQIPIFRNKKIPNKKKKLLDKLREQDDS